MAETVEIPALIDMHSHLRQFGQENKGGFETECESALKGGFRTVLAMPNTLPPVDNAKLVKKTIENAVKIRVLPVACATKNLNSLELVDFKALKKAGAIAFSNDGLPISDKNTFKNVLKSGELIISHCEDETNEVKWQIQIFKKVADGGEIKPRLHFAHISKKASLDLIRKTKKEFKNLTCETCPHYFTFTENNITENGVFKMNPPLRKETDRQAVIEAVNDGTIDVISTDHAPHANFEKLLPYNEAPNGITGFETAFSLTYMTFGLEKTIEKMAKNPAKILGIKNDEKIKADLTAKWIVKGADFASKCKVTPYENMEMTGKILW